MAASIVDGPTSASAAGRDLSLNGRDDPFTEMGSTPARQGHLHRYSSRYDLDHSPFGAISSPTQVKKALEAHLLDTERRLQDTKVLGESLLAQQSKLQDKLREVDEQQDEAEITPELRQQLKSIGQEHDDVSREIARSLLGPKSRAVSGEEQHATESAVYTSQASGSPTKISAPSRRQRNQPTSRTADVQFAADISVSLLAQVRALQAAVAERDDLIKTANSDRLKLEADVSGLAQRLRTHDENEQRYKDENWNLETSNHELLAAAKDAGDKEKRVNASLGAALTERTRLLSELEETKSAHVKLTEEHAAVRKSHETELHSLKRNVDLADSERATLHSRIDELTSQNQELARAISGKYRNITPNQLDNTELDPNGVDRDVETPEHSPPPSPTKATPRHGGLESETLRSSLHHAHRQIQNLKGTIHREKTDKIELKRMLQDARDELEQHRSGLGGASKKSRSRPDAFKKPARPDMLGSNRRSRTDIEMDDESWEDQETAHVSTSLKPAMPPRTLTNMTDLSDTYQTAHETENDFETADERQTTESEAFETGAESLGGDSSDDLTETEDNIPRGGGTDLSRSTLEGRAAGNRSSYYSTASTSAGEEDDDRVQTPIQTQPHRFRLRNGRNSTARQSVVAHDSTPDSVRTLPIVEDSPLTVTAGRSPQAAQQSLFAELGGLDDASSDTYGTPARSSIAAPTTPGSPDTPSIHRLVTAAPMPESKPTMVDAGTVTEIWPPAPTVLPLSSLSGLLAMHSIEPSTVARPPSASDFPLPPSVPVSPVRRLDTSTQYTPQRMLHDSPLRNTAFITPPKTTWDEAHETESPLRDHPTQPVPTTPITSFAYSKMLAQQTLPNSPPPVVAARPTPSTYSAIVSQDTTPIFNPTPAKLVTSTPAVGEPTEAEPVEPRRPVSAVATSAGGFLAGAAAALGLTATGKDSSTAATTKDHISTDLTHTSDADDTQRPDVAAAVVHGNSRPAGADDLSHGPPVQHSSNDQGSQTTLTAQQIEQALKPKSPMAVAPAVVPSSRQPSGPMRSPPLVTLPEADDPFTSQPPVPALSPNRPGSASSQRTPSLTAQVHPPLPQDYRTTIARANSQVSVQGAPLRDGSQPAPTVMGPPLMPASAMRRPHTPGESMRSPTRETAPSRASQSSRIHRGTVNSQLSRQSSVSSFASELDDRFNIRPDAQTLAGQQYQGPATDPRMIQAITQTMIGEYLWKYTRKAGSREFSSTRHRRYFWVHPYNKTLHWSVNDPQASGRREATSKGVVIESVRVVTDDNPMPPGLHRKSLEIVTPGRKIKLTATTGQRHETWFNALSYLLLRGDPADRVGAYATGGNEITRDDLEEFTANNYHARLVPNASRVSMSSYDSRTTSNTAYRTSRQALPSNVVTSRAASRQSMRASAATGGEPTSASVEDGPTLRHEDGAPREGDRDRTIRAKGTSRISKLFGSVTGHQTSSSTAPVGTLPAHSHRRQESDSSIYDASIVSDSRRDSAEEMRQEMLRQEAMGLSGSEGLENVRACCDGKHDVSMLGHGGHKHGRSSGTLQSLGDRFNRSVSRRS